MTDQPLTLTIDRRFPAPRARVFDAWTNPNSQVGWWGPAGFSLVFNEIDLRQGGHWRLGMRAPDGKLHVSQGVYREIAPPERLVMTHGWEGDTDTDQPETLVTVVLEESEGGTDMHFEQTGFATVASRDGHRRGWTEALDSLAAALAR